ncbi:hypothetical protein ACJJTC_005264 [Scirpophaga incertulas]
MPDSESTCLKDTLKKRSSIKGRLTKFKEYLAVLSQIKPSDLTGAQIKEISLRLTKFQELFNVFGELQDQIEILCTDYDEQLKERDFIESQFYSLISIAQDLIESIPQNKEQYVRASKRDDISNRDIQLIYESLPFAVSPPLLAPPAHSAYWRARRKARAPTTLYLHENYYYQANYTS